MPNLLEAVLVWVIIVFVFDRIFTPGPQDKKPVRNVKIAVGDTQFTARTLTEKVSVRWQDIRRVTIVNTDRIPWMEVVFYHIHHSGGDIILPSKARGADDLVSRIKTLPGFDADAFARIGALTRTDTFVVILHDDEAPA
jgi:hypothetical protein